MRDEAGLSDLKQADKAVRVIVGLLKTMLPGDLEAPTAEAGPGPAHGCRRRSDPADTLEREDMRDSLKGNEKAENGRGPHHHRRLEPLTTEKLSQPASPPALQAMTSRSVKAIRPSETISSIMGRAARTPPRRPPPRRPREVLREPEDGRRYWTVPPFLNPSMPRSHRGSRQSLSPAASPPGAGRGAGGGSGRTRRYRSLNSLAFPSSSCLQLPFSSDCSSDPYPGCATAARHPKELFPSTLAAVDEKSPVRANSSTVS